MAEKKPTFDLKRSGAQYHFNLVAPNGEAIATSERYTTKAAAQHGIDAVKRYAPQAEIDDQT